jgi:putative ABC transport system substrate-binding protein
MGFARSIVLAFALALAAPPRAEAQNKVHRLGVLSVSVQSVELTHSATVPALAQLGFVAGRNLSIISRVGTGERMTTLARDLLAEKPDVILAVGWEAISAARAATTTVPIVFFGPDPVRLGYAESLSRPGGNVTGVLILATELDGKRLQLLYEAVPGARRAAALARPNSPNRLQSDRDMRAVAAAAGRDLQIFEVARAADYGSAFAAMRGAGMDAVAIVADPEFYRDTAELARRAREAKLPTVCQWSEMAAAGCVLSYGPSIIGLRTRIAEYIARLFKGANPGDLPIEQPSKFELVVNLRAARAVGLTIPEAFLLRADQVIE